MSERIDDVRATSDALLADTQRLYALEVEKRRLDPGSRRFRDLSLQIEDLGTNIAALTSIEREVAEPLERPKGSGPKRMAGSDTIRRAPSDVPKTELP